MADDASRLQDGARHAHAAAAQAAASGFGSILKGQIALTKNYGVLQVRANVVGITGVLPGDAGMG